jgi:hypothetical protein
MVATRAPSGSEGLKTQIAQTEKRILDRQQLIRQYVTACRRDMWNSLTSPTVLFSAGGVGFVIGILSRQNSAGSHDGAASKLPAGKRFDGVLKCIAMIRTLLPTLRFVATWLFPQPEASSGGKAVAVDTSTLG